jgi:hypothetical protein
MARDVDSAMVPLQGATFMKTKTSRGGRREMNCVNQETQSTELLRKGTNSGNGDISKKTHNIKRLLDNIPSNNQSFTSTARYAKAIRPMGWRTGNTLHSYSRSARFESLLKQCLSWLKFFVIFLGPSRKIRDMISIRHPTIRLSIVYWRCCKIPPPKKIRMLQ